MEDHGHSMSKKFSAMVEWSIFVRGGPPTRMLNARTGSEVVFYEMIDTTETMEGQKKLLSYIVVLQHELQTGRRIF